jgi:hypothetical protein
MKHSLRNQWLALAALVGLAAYILACTSFSPDDKKILYPAVDPESGHVGLAVYDRAAKQSRMVYLPLILDTTAGSEPELPLLRGQFLADGQSIVAVNVYTGGGGNDLMTVTTLPWGVSGMHKVFHLNSLNDPEAALASPLVVAGNRLFLMGSNQVLRLDLKNGVLDHHPTPDLKDIEWMLYPAPRGDAVFYFQSDNERNTTTFGTMHPDTFKPTPLQVFTNKPMEASFLAYDHSGKRLALVEEVEERPQLVVLENGKTTFTRRLGGPGQVFRFGSGMLSPKGNEVIVSYQRLTQNETNVVYGLMEIPLSEAPVRETILIRRAANQDEMNVLYFQGAVSHDGKTAAVASTYLVCADTSLGADDCALFLVDLTDANRKVTKIPIALPRNRSGLVSK